MHSEGFKNIAWILDNSKSENKCPLQSPKKMKQGSTSKKYGDLPLSYDDNELPSTLSLNHVLSAQQY